MTPHRLLITGAAGEVGTALREITEQRQGGVFVDSGYVGRAKG